jgi:3',5'-cyclic AMP phosphodiesterase CpdA
VIPAVAAAAAVVLLPALVWWQPWQPWRSEGAAPATSSSSGAAGAQVGPAAAGSVTVAAVGDLACPPGHDVSSGQCQERAVADLLVSRAPAAFLPLGDNQYENGTLNDYRNGYDRSYGRLLEVTRPVPGNHEYNTRGAAGYYDYFGARAGERTKGYYSYDLGGWHLVALNSNCDDVPCGRGSEQERWLRADLAANPATCTLAYWHHPRWSDGEHGDLDRSAALVQALYDDGVELLLVGHDHDYERYAPRAPSGAADPQRGLRQIVVGTGGRSLRAADPGPGVDAMDARTFGALFLTLTPTSYSWQFAAAAGGSFADTGSAACH